MGFKTDFALCWVRFSLSSVEVTSLVVVCGAVEWNELRLFSLRRFMTLDKIDSHSPLVNTANKQQ